MYKDGGFSPGESFRHALIDNVFIVVWNEVSTGAASRITSLVRDGHRSRGPLVYVAVVPDVSTPPDDDGRAALAGAVEQLLPFCSSMHCVIEGAGFKKSIVRAAATGIFMVSGQRGKMTVHDTFAHALESAPDLGSSAAREVTRRAVDQNLFP